VLLALPFVVLFYVAAGALTTMFAVALVVILGALVRTISETLGQVRSAKRVRRTALY
jgi:hypothetical protein